MVYDIYAARIIFSAPLFYNESTFTYAEIAARYGLFDRQVKREIHKALSQLRVALKDYQPIALLLFCSR